MPSDNVSGQGGAALIMALLTMTLVAGVAAFVVKDYGAAVDSVSGRRDQAQARLLAKGAVDWARNVLAADAKTSSLDHYNETWATRVPATPVEEGEVGGELDDISGRFDLNGVARTRGSDPEQVRAYSRLLVELGIPQSQAAALTDSLVAWNSTSLAQVARAGAEKASETGIMTAGKAVGVSLVDIDELKQVDGYTIDLVSRIKPFVAALPAATPLNVNTAPAEVLAAVIPRLEIDQARILVAQRQVVPFKNVADFTSRLPTNVAAPDAARFAVGGRFFVASVRASFGQSTTRMQVLLDRRKTWPDIVWQKLL
jgi:general secretion pathway protein K